jgi:integrase
MAISKYLDIDGNVAYQAKPWDRGVPLPSKSFKRKQDAKEWHDRQKAILRDRKVGRLKGSSITFEEYFEQIYWPQRTISDGTSVDYRSMFEIYLKPEFGSEFLADILPEDFGKFLRKLVDLGKLSASRVNRIHTAASSILSKATREGYVAVNPLHGIDYFREDTERFDYWSKEEVISFLNWAFRTQNPRSLIYKLALETGMRLGEILGLKKKSLDFANGIIRVGSKYCSKTKKIHEQTKNGKVRRLGMSNALGFLMRSHCEGHPNELVFCREDGRFLTDDYLSCHIERDIKLCGEVHRITFHDLRHTYASHFMMNGGNIYELQILLGHSNIKTTERYAHLSHTHLQRRGTLVNWDFSSTSTISQLSEEKGGDEILPKSAQMPIFGVMRE